MTEPIQTNLTPSRMASKTDLQSGKAQKVEGDNNTVWHTGIKGYDENQLAMQYMAKTIKGTDYAIFDRNSDTDKKDGRLSKAQEDFLVQNQIEVDQVKHKDGSIDTFFVNQKDKGDNKITKGELLNSINLRKSLENVKPENLTQDEKDFIKGFDASFGKKDNKDTAPFVADYRQRGHISIYSFVEGQPAFKPRYLKDEKNILVDLGNGKYTYMSEKEGYGNPYKHLGAAKIIPAWENYTYPENKYKNVDAYINKLPKDIEKFQKEQNEEGAKECKEAMERDYTPINAMDLRHK